MQVPDFPFQSAFQEFSARQRAAGVPRHLHRHAWNQLGPLQRNEMEQRFRSEQELYEESLEEYHK